MSVTEHNRTSDWKYPKYPLSNSTSDLAYPSKKGTSPLPMTEPASWGVSTVAVNVYKMKWTLLFPLLSSTSLCRDLHLLSENSPPFAHSTHMAAKEGTMTKRWWPSVASFQPYQKCSLGKLKLRNGETTFPHFSYCAPKKLREENPVQGRRQGGRGGANPDGKRKTMSEGHSWGLGYLWVPWGIPTSTEQILLLAQAKVGFSSLTTNTYTFIETLHSTSLVSTINTLEAAAWG